jgi:hypothetical protein
MLLKSIFIVINVIATIFLVIACSEPEFDREVSDYDRLCDLYKEVIEKTNNPAMIGMELNQRTKEEIPEVHVHFKNISNADPKIAYKMFKEIAEKETGRNWECKEMQNFYSSD